MQENTCPPPAAEIDARGLHCPLPILRAKKALATLQSGQLLRGRATAPGAGRDFPAFAQQTGTPLVAQRASAGEVTHVLRRR